MENIILNYCKGITDFISIKYIYKTRLEISLNLSIDELRIIYIWLIKHETYDANIKVSFNLNKVYGRP
ncbi:hypothetical protein GCM10022422_09430 [Flavobacterium ginsengisoli]|uniref:Uncharacterized protein n=1 Tax=Flavobacterium ginsengisoli TaxID=871694 RepID=A0ABP7F6U3_9FLAO